jgi:hypothetical protein
MKGSVGQPVAVPISVDSNGASLASIQTELEYNPLDMQVALSPNALGLCRAILAQTQDTVNGSFSVTCTAPSGGNTTRTTTLITFTATPLRPGILPLHVVGRSSDYGVIAAQ